MERLKKVMILFSSPVVVAQAVAAATARYIGHLAINEKWWFTKGCKTK
jgi:hypothetical protein